VPTIFSFSKGKEQQPKRRRLVSIDEVVSGIPMSAVNSNEEVAYVDNGSSANSHAVNQSNVMMMEDTSEQAFVGQDVVHDDITLTANVCEDFGLGSSVQHTNRSGVSDHCYYISESPKTLKRKTCEVKEKLCVTRKKLRLKGQQTRRLKAKVFFP